MSYYLTTPSLYFDQKNVMEAVLYLDKVNGTNNFSEQLVKWARFEEMRTPMEDQTVDALAKLLEEEQGKSVADKFQQSISDHKNKKADSFTTEYFDEQIPILIELNQYQ